MQSADTVLELLRDRGKRGLPLERVYRQLFNPALYLKAYGRIARNAGALTPGVTDETADGMSLDQIQHIIALLRQERLRWLPARRTYIEKKGSTKRRPLGIPTWSAKLLQEVVRLLLEAYYEPQFSDHAHGFRAGRGCHTALAAIRHGWKGTVWFIEGDISACFDSLDHSVLLAILGEQIHDNRFLRLIENLLKAGYLEDWRYHATLSGSPQGAVVSPILANIYLDRLDQFVDHTLIPRWTRGRERRPNPAYQQVVSWRKQARKAGNRTATLRLTQRMRQLPSRDPADPDYRRLRYVRYADDFLLGFAGPKAEAEEIKRDLGVFLRDTLKLELSAAKTHITHGRTTAARFLGYELVTLHDDHKLTRHRDGPKQRSITALVGLKVPLDVVQQRCTRYLRHGAPIHRPERQHDAVFSIVAQYAAEYRGLVAYYQMAYNLHRFNRLKWVMETSLSKTLAAKLRISVREVYRRYQTTVMTARGPRRVLRVTLEREGKAPLVATWGDVDLVHRPDATLADQPQQVWNVGTEIVERLLADTCELCGAHDRIEVHHIRALKDLYRPGRPEKPAWQRQMAARQRTKLVVCHTCHGDIQHGKPRRRASRAGSTGELDDAKVSRPVRGGAVGNVPG